MAKQKSESKGPNKKKTSLEIKPLPGPPADDQAAAAGDQGNHGKADPDAAAGDQGNQGKADPDQAERNRRQTDADPPPIINHGDGVPPHLLNDDLNPIVPDPEPPKPKKLEILDFKICALAAEMPGIKIPSHLEIRLSIKARNGFRLLMGGCMASHPNTATRGQVLGWLLEQISETAEKMTKAKR